MTDRPAWDEHLDRAVSRGFDERVSVAEQVAYMVAYYGAFYIEDEDRVRALRKMSYAAYLRTPEWARKREWAIILAGGRCATCNEAGTLEAHHRTYERLPLENLADLVALCTACHTAVHLAIDARKGKVRSRSRRVVPV